jgi:hypothetical protein
LGVGEAAASAPETAAVEPLPAVGSAAAAELEPAPAPPAFGAELGWALLDAAVAVGGALDGLAAAGSVALGDAPAPGWLAPGAVAAAEEAGAAEFAFAASDA